MAVPAHDERDHAFAKTYGLPIVQVVAPQTAHAIDVQEGAFTDDGVALGVRRVRGVTARRAPRAAPKIAWLEAQGAGAHASRTSCATGSSRASATGASPSRSIFPSTTSGDPRERDRLHHPLRPAHRGRRERLPLRLPDLEDFRPGGDPAGPLARVADWRFFQKDGKWFARETNTMPQWAGSCWYYLRYLDPKNDDRAVQPTKAYDAWMPVDLYVGGGEHAVLHLLYARFWHKVLVRSRGS